MLKFGNDLRVKSQGKIESVVDVLVVEGMLVVSDELVDVDEVVLNESVELVYDLQGVDILGLSKSALLRSQQDHKFHQDLLDLLIKTLSRTAFLSFFFLYEQQVVLRYDSCEDIPNDLVVGLHHEGSAELVCDIYQFNDNP